MKELDPRDRRDIDASTRARERLRDRINLYTIATSVEDRALSASPTTTELRDMLATLIQDLQEALR